MLTQVDCRFCCALGGAPKLDVVVKRVMMPVAFVRISFVIYLMLLNSMIASCHSMKVDKHDSSIKLIPNIHKERQTFVAQQNESIVFNDTKSSLIRRTMTLTNQYKYKI